MNYIPYPELKQKILSMPLHGSDIVIRKGDVIVDEALFIKSHLKMLDDHPPKPDLTDEQKKFRMTIVKPFYERLHAYYLVKSQLC